MAPFFQSAYVCPYIFPWVVCEECDILHCWMNPKTTPIRGPLLLGTVVSGVGFGRAFCSWICPYGTLLQTIERWRRLPPNVWSPRGPLFRWVKVAFGLFTLAVVLGMLYPILVVRGLVTPGMMPYLDPFYLAVNPVLITLIQHRDFWWGLRMVFIAGFILAAFWIGKAWCKICPLGYLFSGLNRVSLFKLDFRAPRCIKPETECSACQVICPEGLDPVIGEAESGECTRCMECVVACPVGKVKAEAYVNSHGGLVVKAQARGGRVVKARGGRPEEAA
jgi:polyferredoxin